MFMSEKSIEEYIEKMRNRYARMTGRRGRRGKRGAPKPYDTDTRDALKTCWLSMNQPCGKRITDMLPLWSRPLDCSLETRGQLDHIIAASIDRMLKLWSLWRNLFCVTMKQSRKRREVRRKIRIHQKQSHTPASLRLP